MPSTVARQAPAKGKAHRNHGPIAPGERTGGRPESPLRIDAEAAMNAVAALDDAIRTALNARRALVAGFATYEIPNGPRGPKRAA